METPAFKLDGKAAIVTGAASGIGHAIATTLGAAGAAVCVGDLDEEGSRRVAGEIERSGGRAIAVRTDVSRADQVEALVRATAEAFGSMDILVNNAGLQHVAPVHEFPLEKWNQLIGVMLTGTFLCTRAALPYMMTKRWGRVVNISSIHGLVASPFKSAYISAEHGITANAVCPGYVRTPLVEGQIADQARVHGIPTQQVVETIMLAPSALKRLLEPEEVASLVLYLCSEAAAGITGAAYSIDGGWTAR